MTTLNQNENWNELENRTIGIEIECFVPTNILRGEGSYQEFVSNKLNQAGVNASYQHSHITNAPTTWTVKHDGSLGHGGVEIVSPVLKYNPDSFVTLQKVCGVLDDIRATVNTQCGLHVHVSNRDLTLKQNKLIAKRYAKFEDVFDYFMPRSRRTNTAGYCRSLRARSEGTPVEIINQTMQKIDSCRSINALQRLFGGSHPRYAKLNFTSPHGTVEFRHHSGTVNFEKISKWVRLCHSVVMACKNNKPVKKIDATRNGTRTLNHRFKVLMNGLTIDSTAENFFRKRMKHFIQQDGQPRTVQIGTVQTNPIDVVNRLIRQIESTGRFSNANLDEIYMLRNEGELVQANTLALAEISRIREGR